MSPKSEIFGLFAPSGDTGQEMTSAGVAHYGRVVQGYISLQRDSATVLSGLYLGFAKKGLGSIRVL